MKIVGVFLHWVAARSGAGQADAKAPQHRLAQGQHAQQCCGSPCI